MLGGCFGAMEADTQRCRHRGTQAQVSAAEARTGKGRLSGCMPMKLEGGGRVPSSAGARPPTRQLNGHYGSGRHAAWSCGRARRVAVESRGSRVFGS